MKIKVKLSGLLAQRFPDYDAATGIDLAMPDGSTVEDLLIRLRFGPSDGGIATCDGRVLQAHQRLPKGKPIMIFPIVDGG